MTGCSYLRGLVTETSFPTLTAGRVASEGPRRDVAHQGGELGGHARSSSEWMLASLVSLR
jgi:hypothetical protein